MAGIPILTGIMVPPQPMKGRMREVEPGRNEGEPCYRSDGQGGLCHGRIEHLPDPMLDGGCSCHISPPCNHCLSTMPECTACGWREDGSCE